MKKFADLSKVEVLNLTTEQIEKYVDLQCAIDGVRLLPLLVSEPEKPAMATTTAYKVGDLVFLDMEKAQGVADAINDAQAWTSNYDYNVGYDYRFLKRCNVSEVSTIKAFSPEEWVEIKDRMQEYAVKRKEYEQQIKEYKEFADARARVSRDIWEVVDEYRDEQANIEQIRQKFTQYLDLAEGNNRIAIGFLLHILLFSDELRSEFEGKEQNVEGFENVD